MNNNNANNNNMIYNNNNNFNQPQQQFNNGYQAQNQGMNNNLNYQFQNQGQNNNQQNNYQMNINFDNSPDNEVKIINNGSPEYNDKIHIISKICKASSSLSFISVKYNNFLLKYFLTLFLTHSFVLSQNKGSKSISISFNFFSFRKSFS